MISTNLKTLCGAVLVGSMLAVSGPAGAAEEALKKYFRFQLENGNITQQQYDELIGDLEKDSEAMQEQVEERVSEATKDMPKITTKEKFEIESQDGNFVWGIGGRVMADAALYDDDGGTDLGSGSEIRRGRLEMDATLWKVWNFKFQFDFTDSGSDGIRDAYISYAGFPNTKLQVGHFKEPFSLEELTSSKYITFMERSLPNAFAPSRALGIGAYIHFADMLTVSGGFFGDGIDTSNDDGIDSGYGVTGRLTFSPIHEDGRALHFGSAISHRATDDDGEVRFRERMESHLDSNRIADTGDIADVDDFLRYGLEAAAVYDRFSLQGEFIRTDVNRDLAGDLGFDGFYVYGSVFLTPDSRAYKFTEGAFDKVSPKSVVGKGGIGAWELGLRFSSLDLRDGIIEGGEADLLTVGLNWYATKNIRFMANYVTVLDSSGDVFGDGTAGSGLPGAEPAVFQTRAQVFW